MFVDPLIITTTIMNLFFLCVCVWLWLIKHIACVERFAHLNSQTQSLLCWLY